MATVTSLRVALNASYNDKKAFARLRHDIRRTAEDQSFLTESTRRVTRAFMTVGPVAVPVMAAAAKAAAQAGTAMGAAAAGVALFGAAAKSQLGNFTSTWQRVQALNQIMKENKKGTEAWEKANEKKKHLLAQLDPLERKAYQNMLALQNAWKGFGKTVRPQIFQIMGVGIQTLIIAMQRMEPALKPISAVVLRIARDMQRMVAGPGFVKFVNWIKANAAPAMWSMWVATKNLTRGFVTLLARMGALNTSGFNQWLVRVTASFDRWAHSESAGKLINFLNQASAATAPFATALLRLAGTVSTALGPLGLSILKALTPILNWMAGFISKNPAVVQGLWLLYAAMKALAFANIVASSVALLGVRLVWLGKISKVVAVEMTLLNTRLGLMGLGISTFAKNSKIMTGALAAIRFALKWTGIQAAATWVMALGPVAWIIAGIIAVGAAVIYAYNKFAWFRNFVNAVGRAIVGVAKWWWTNFKANMLAIGRVISWLYNNIIAPIGRGIAAVFRWVMGVVRGVGRVIGNIMYWVGATIKVVAYLVWTALKAVFGPAFSWAGRLVSSVVKWIVRSALTMYQWLYVRFYAIRRIISNVLGAAFRWVGGVISNVATWISNRVSSMAGWVGRVLKGLRNWLGSVFGPAWRWIGGVISSVAGWINKRISWVGDRVSRIFKVMRAGMATVNKAFWAGAHAIGRAWNWMAEYARKPIRWVINTVWNNGVVPIWNAVAGKVGVKKVGKVKGFARGGVLPGYGSAKRDTMMTPMRAGEGVLVPEVVKALGPGVIHGLNALGNSRGVAGTKAALGKNGGNPVYGAKLSKGRGGAENQGPIDRYLFNMSRNGFALGGIVGNFVKAAKNSFVGKLYDKVVNGAMSPLMKGTKAWGTNPEQIKAYPGFVGRYLLNAIKNKLLSFSSQFSGGSAVVDAARSYIGKGDTRGDNSGNMFNKMFGFGDGTPWCANFVSASVKKAHAQKFYPGYPTASVYGYYSKMKKVAFKNAQPGDLRTTGTNQHINIVENMTGGKLTTIGGNEGPKVRRSQNYQSGHILRPKPGAPGGAGAFGGGSIPKGSRLALLQQALRMAGVKPTAAWLRGMNTLIQRESGWNAGAFNNWDSNARAGNASRGLAQIIPTTFRAHAKKGWSINNPVHNVAAAIRYIVSRYGSIGNVQQANPNKPPKGYAAGVRNAPRGLAWVGENGAELMNFRGGESVLNNEASMAALGGTTCTHLHIDGNVYVKDEREFRKMVREALDKDKRRSF